MVPRPKTPAPEPQRESAFFTYNALPAPTPPVDTSALEGALPAPGPEPSAPEPAPPAAEQPPAAPPVPPPTEPPVAPPPPAPREKPPKPPREPLSTGMIVAGVVTLVLLIGSGIAALLLRGGDDEEPRSAAVVESTPGPERTAEPTPEGPDLRQQVMTLDDLMKRSQQGRAAAASGDTEAAIANRSALLKDLLKLRGEVEDAKLKAGLASFVAAIRESLRQNRECANACPPSDLDKVNALKRETVKTLNPLLRKYAKTSYQSREI
ncbi:MAG TPA: hypothetical protein VFZ00_28960 [Solirubrobacter sp.]|nr:hypothetical protein [Solirubrobacter sp.]